MECRLGSLALIFVLMQEYLEVVFESLGVLKSGGNYRTSQLANLLSGDNKKGS